MGNIQDRRSLLAGMLASLWLASPFMNVVASAQLLPRPTLDIHTHLFGVGDAAEVRHILYVSDMNLAQAAWEDARVGRVRKLLKQHEPQPGQEDLRGFEWHHWNRLVHSNQMSLDGHRSIGTVVVSVAFSTDGKRLVSTGGDQTVRVWDATTGQEMLTFRGHTGMTMSATFSPDGKRVATAIGDGKVKIWDATSGQEMLTIKGDSVAFSPDWTRLASASFDQTVKIWDATTGQETFTLKGHTSAVTCVAISPDGKRLASASSYGDHTVKVWDTLSGQEKLTLSFSDSAGTVTSVAFSPDGKRLVSANGDQLKVWDTVGGQEMLSWKGHTYHSNAPGSTQSHPVTSVAFSPDGHRLASASFDQTVKVWRNIEEEHRGQALCAIFFLIRLLQAMGFEFLRRFFWHHHGSTVSRGFFCHSLLPLYFPVCSTSISLW